MGSYKWSYKSLNMVYNYSYPTYKPTYKTTHEPPSMNTLLGVFKAFLDLSWICIGV